MESHKSLYERTSAYSCFGKGPFSKATVKTMIEDARLITALSNLKATAEGCSSDFAAGYLMAIGHAIELAEVIEARRQQEGQ